MLKMLVSPQDLEGRTELSDRMSARISAPKVLLLADLSLT